MVMRSLCSLTCFLKIKLHPGIQISWLHCAQGIILMQILQQPGLVVLFQSEPGPTRTTTRAWRTCKVPNFSSSQVKGRPRDPLLCTAGPCVGAKGHLPKAPGHGRAKGPLLHNQVPSEVRTNVSSRSRDGLPVTVVGTDAAEV